MAERVKVLDMSVSREMHDLVAWLATEGALFAAYGRYLSTRIDVVPEELCRLLSAIPDEAPPSDSELVRNTFVAELGRGPEWTFAEFDPIPYLSRILFQLHHARIGHSDVVVKVIHPEIRQSQSELDKLEERRDRFAAFGMSAAVVESTLKGFRCLLDTAFTVQNELDAALVLAQDARRLDLISSPKIWRHLCGRTVCVYGATRRLPQPQPHGDADLARMVCLAWLVQALQGDTYPLEPDSSNIGIANDGRIVFDRGPFGSLESTVKLEVLQHLIAVAADNADDAARHLAAAMGGLPDQLRDELRRLLRQMAPFRDGYSEFDPAGSQTKTRQFTEEVLVHWRMATEVAGTRSDAVTPFYRGLLLLARTAHSLAPQSDSLAEALRDLRLMTAFNEVKNLIKPSEAPALLESYASAMMRMPEGIDRILNNGPSQSASHSAPTSTTDGQSQTVALMCQVIALAAVGMLAHRFTASAAATSARAVALLFLLAGGAVLFAAFRRR